VNVNHANVFDCQTGLAVLQIAELQSDIDSSTEHREQLRASYEEQMVRRT